MQCRYVDKGNITVVLHVTEVCWNCLNNWIQDGWENFSDQTSWLQVNASPWFSAGMSDNYFMNVEIIYVLPLSRYAKQIPEFATTCILLVRYEIRLGIEGNSRHWEKCCINSSQIGQESLEMMYSFDDTTQLLHCLVRCGEEVQLEDKLLYNEEAM